MNEIIQWIDSHFVQLLFIGIGICIILVFLFWVIEEGKKLRESEKERKEE